MKETIKLIIRNLTESIPIPISAGCAGLKLFTPYYHIVCNKIPWYVGDRYKIKTPEQFIADLEIILKYFEPIDLITLIHKVKNNQPFTRRAFFLSFDDGYRELADIIAPILLKKGVPATFFLCTSLIDNQSIYFENELTIIRAKFEQADNEQIEKINKLIGSQNINHLGYNDKEVVSQIADILELNIQNFLEIEKPYITSVQINDLIQKGFTIGSHSIDHPLFKHISFNEKIRQTAQSIDWLTRTFNIDYKVFAFPYGDFGVTKPFFDYVFQSGMVDLCFGTSGLISEAYPQSIQRFWMENHAKPTIRHIKSAIAEKIIRQWVSNDKISRVNEI